MQKIHTNHFTIFSVRKKTLFFYSVYLENVNLEASEGLNIVSLFEQMISLRRMRNEEIDVLRQALVPAVPNYCPVLKQRKVYFLMNFPIDNILPLLLISKKYVPIVNLSILNVDFF